MSDIPETIEAHGRVYALLPDEREVKRHALNRQVQEALTLAKSYIGPNRMNLMYTNKDEINHALQVAQLQVMTALLEFVADE